jgi:hypothetical protein
MTMEPRLLVKLCDELLGLSPRFAYYKTVDIGEKYRHT